MELPKWAKWIATDSDGAVYAYDSEPYQLNRVWDTDSQGLFVASGDPDPNWKDSLRAVGDTPAVESDVVSATEFLEFAAGHMRARAATYDQPTGERSMGKTVAAFNAITGHSLKESEGWLLMLLLKQVRLFQRDVFHRDSAEDAVAYAALLAEAKGKEG